MTADPRPTAAPTAAGALATPALAELPFDQLARRADTLRAKASAHPDPAVRALLGDALAAITEFNRRGLSALVSELRADPAAAEVLYRAVDTPEVMALLAAHGIIRTGPALDVLTVVEAIRPHLVMSAVDLTVEEVVDDVAYVSFGAACSAPEQQSRDEVMALIKLRVPGLREVVEVSSGGPAFVPLTALRVGPP